MLISDYGHSADLTQFRTECNALRDELHAIRIEIRNQLAEDYRRYVAELGKMYENEVNSFCALRDEAVKAAKGK
jgi:hypothetical protein